MLYLGAVLFILLFILIAPQSQIFLLGLASGAGAWITAWAPFSYVILMILLVGPFAGIYVVRSWPQTVEPENPMSKYRKEVPVEEED
jgi:hypothetical protein